MKKIKSFWKHLLFGFLGLVFCIIGHINNEPLYPSKQEAIRHAQQMLVERKVVLDTVPRAVRIPYRGQEYLVDAQIWNQYLESQKSPWIVLGVMLIIVAMLSAFIKFALSIQDEDKS